MTDIPQYKSTLTGTEIDAAMKKMAQLDDGIAQAKQYAEQAQGYAESINPGNFYTKEQADSEFAPRSHSSTLATYGTGSSAVYGHVKLSDTLNGASAANGGGTAATPKCVQDAIQEAMTPQRLTPTWENGFTDSGATRIWRIGFIIVCQFNLLMPTVSGGAWRGVLTIPGVNPGTNVNGRISTVVSGSARDYLITAGGELRIYISDEDSGHTLNLPLVFVSTV